MEELMANKEKHPNLILLAGLLRLNCFSESYINMVINRTEKELSHDMLDDFIAVKQCIIRWIGEGISIYHKQSDPQQGRIIALVGTSGVGKTTTIAKLAANFVFDNSPNPTQIVQIISTDDFHLGARSKIEAYGSLLEIPVSFVTDKSHMKKEIDRYSRERSILLIDTIGTRNDKNLTKMKELLDECGKEIEIHLTIPANILIYDIENILREFSLFNYCSVILTRLDETSCIGNIISVLADKKIPVSYITCGEKVPADIHNARASFFINRLIGF